MSMPKITRFKRPSTLITTFDCQSDVFVGHNSGRAVCVGNVSAADVDQGITYPGYKYVVKPHTGNSNCLWLDGHVKGTNKFDTDNWPETRDLYK